MTSTTRTLTFKAYNGCYVACAPEAGIWSFGTCFEEAANGLTEQIHSVETNERRRLARKGNSYVVR